MIPDWHSQKETLKFIGKTLTATIDRPLGSTHPQHGFIYPINYGYVAGVVAGDGEFQDAYILGVDEPLKQFTGKCIAVILREDDVEAKLVLCDRHIHFSSEEITALVSFQEQFFHSKIITENKTKGI